jgi:hypothetical protein
MTETDASAEAMLHALRERGAQRVDPLRFRLLESLLRRATGQQGPARQWLDGKAATLLQALNDAVSQAEEAPSTITEAMQGELGKLLAHIAQLKPEAAHAISAIPEAPGPISPSKKVQPPAKKAPDAAVDPKTLQFFRRTWSRLSSDQRLAQSRSSLPENAGPLNSQHMVHRSLNVMRELSPEYFDLFISHVDALLWLERANEQAAREVGLSPRAKGGKKAPGGKRG